MGLANCTDSEKIQASSKLHSTDLVANLFSEKSMRKYLVNFSSLANIPQEMCRWSPTARYQQNSIINVSYRAFKKADFQADGFGFRKIFTTAKCVCMKTIRLLDCY